LEEICKSCMDWFDCPHHDPWGKKRFFRFLAWYPKVPTFFYVSICGDVWWCDYARDEVNGTDSTREELYSPISNEQPMEIVRARPVTWEHTIKSAKMTKTQKIRELIARGYSNDEILMTLGIKSKENSCGVDIGHIYSVRSKMKKPPLRVRRG